MGKAKRLGILGAVIAVMALMVGAVSPALGSSSQGSGSTSSGQADEQQTIRVLAVFTEFDANIDVGAPGLSLGDEVVFSGNLLRNGEQVGRRYRRNLWMSPWHENAAYLPP